MPVDLPAAPDENLFPQSPGTNSEHHDCRLEAVRWRLGKRLLYAGVPEELVVAHQDNFVAEYCGQSIMLRADLDYADESMALCHELLHVLLHPLSGDSSGVEADEMAREERIVNCATADLCERMGLGEYQKFCDRFSLAHLAADAAEDERAAAEELIKTMLALVEDFPPQAQDAQYSHMKLIPEAELQPGERSEGFTAATVRRDGAVSAAARRIQLG